MTPNSTISKTQEADLPMRRSTQGIDARSRHRTTVAGHFPQDFRAAFSKEISGMRIEQTYYLDQHPRFNEETRTVKIFMDVASLKAMIQVSPGCHRYSNQLGWRRTSGQRI
jgi:hypothetical protein